jgi:hypothetical protein
MAFISFVWKYKVWILLAVVAVSAALIIATQRVNLEFKKAKIEKQKGQIETLTTANKTMNRNAQAARVADIEMKSIQKQAEPLRNLAASLTEKEKEGFNNEKMDRINDCLGAFFNNSVLPRTCIGEAILPQSAAANMGKGR